MLLSYFMCVCVRLALCKGRVLTSAAAGVGGLLFIWQLNTDIPRAWKSSLGGGQMSMCKPSECLVVVVMVTMMM